MRQSSIVIHRGKKEEKYELYVEDYVISFLKKKEKTQEEQILFYGCREKNGRKYTVYGAGVDRHPAVFDKYELLEEVGCRLTGTDPVFLIREKDGVYEVKGYSVFYYDNTEMQDYLIQREGEQSRRPEARACSAEPAQKRPFGRTGHPYNAAGSGQSGGKINPHYAVSLQLGLVFIVLVAIVINSANSFDKMEMLNQSAAEVFFVMENQEAGEVPKQARNDNPEEEEAAVIQADTLPDQLLQESVEQENARADQREENAQPQPETAGTEQTEAVQDGTAQAADTQDGTEQTADAQKGTSQAAEGETEAGRQSGKQNGSSQATDTQKESALPADSGEDGTSQAAEEVASQEDAGTEEGVEALSRNVGRYYEVKRGDTLYMISQRIYGDTSHVKKICELNEITDPDNIHYGQKIILP